MFINFKGRLKVFKVGRHYRVSRLDLYEFTEEMKDDSIVL